MTDNDKFVAFETAINLMLEAQEQLSDAAELFHKCGIELCDTFSWGDAALRLWTESSIRLMGNGI